ncbi:unnamed protein product [Fraxinus pennsylvanica]|uniref:Uncharacterized protein n=1 Tax=Fraxinus pennsylvanica TaxID=56036 RepID=A0AAD1YR98_9LAMI|nr:unnamed protein product [Fraxinus pennsylvanica]
MATANAAKYGRDDKPTKLVTLLGKGGFGKTTAVIFAAQLRLAADGDFLLRGKMGEWRLRRVVWWLFFIVVFDVVAVEPSDMFVLPANDAVSSIWLVVVVMVMVVVVVMVARGGGEDGGGSGGGVLWIVSCAVVLCFPPSQALRSANSLRDAILKPCELKNRHCIVLKAAFSHVWSSLAAARADNFYYPPEALQFSPKAVFNW